MTSPFSGAIDLSGLKTTTTITQNAPPVPTMNIPDGAFACTVEGGCNLVVMGDGKHESVSDCLETTYPYVERFMETRAAAVEVAEEYHHAVAQYRQVLAANQRLAEDNERLKAELRAARKGTEAGEKSVLLGAEDLAASMKANFGPKPEALPEPEGAMCLRCGQCNTEDYYTDGVPYVWCNTCQDDAQ